MLRVQQRNGRRPYAWIPIVFFILFLSISIIALLFLSHFYLLLWSLLPQTCSFATLFLSQYCFIIILLLLSLYFIAIFFLSDLMRCVACSSIPLGLPADLLNMQYKYTHHDTKRCVLSSPIDCISGVQDCPRPPNSSSRGLRRSSRVDAGLGCESNPTFLIWLL